MSTTAQHSLNKPAANRWNLAAAELAELAEIVTAAADVADGQVVDLLTATRDWAQRIGRGDLCTRLDAARNRIDSPVCQVVVLGEFKKGKSSLLNALLNARVCPTDADIATAVPNYLRFHPEFAVDALLQQDGAESLDPAQAQSVALGGSGDEARALRIGLPRELLGAGIVLVDTPGVGGGLASSHAAMALRCLASAHVLLFVADAGSEYGAPELELLARAVSLCPTLICAITKIDLYPEWQRIIDADRAHLERIGIVAPMIPLSAPLRQAGLLESDDELTVESGFPRLTSELLAALDTAATSTQVSAGAVMLSVLGQLRLELTAKRRQLSGPADLEDRREAAEFARRRAQELRGVGGRWQLMLNDRLDDLFGEVELDLTQRLRALRKAAADRIAATHPSRLAADLGPWLQLQTNELLVAHVRRLQEEVEAVADAVAEQFGSVSWELRSGLDLGSLSGAALSSPEFARGAALERRMTKFEVGLAALRGGATGAMVTHAVGLVVGIAVPVVIPAAIALSAVLGGKSWQTARSSQLRMVRAEAERAVGVYLEEVDTVTRKESRDALRRTRRQLREVFAQRAAELLATATRTAAAFDATNSADEQTRVRELAAVEGQLAELTALARQCRSFVDALVPAP